MLTNAWSMVPAWASPLHLHSFFKPAVMCMRTRWWPAGAGGSQVPLVFLLPDDSAQLLTSEEPTGSPYAFVRSLITRERDSNKAAQLYVTGHR